MGCWWMRRNGKRKGWFAAIFCIIELFRRSVSTLAIIVRRALIIAAGIELVRLIDISSVNIYQVRTCCALANRIESASITSVSD